MLSFKKFICFILLITSISRLIAQDTIRYMQYNLMNYGNGMSICTSANNPTELKDIYIRTIVDYVKPDLFAVVEIASNSGTIQHLLDEALNTNGISYWQKAQMSNFSGSGIINMLYYNKDKFALKSQDVVVNGLRDINIYTLYYKSGDLSFSNDTLFFNVIIAHLKAGNSQDDELERETEVNQLMQYISLSYQPGNFLISGDFNLYSSNEPAYNKLLNFSSAAFRFFDPIDSPGDWNNNYNFADIHTQSTHTSSNGCPSTGGLDDRFDFILISDAIMTGLGKMHAMPETYKAVGQDGQHFNSSLNALPVNASVPDTVIEALYGNSDHLPVVMDMRLDKTLGIETSGNHEIWFSVTNPCKDQIRLDFNAMTGKNIIARLFDVNGQEIINQQCKVPAWNKITLSIPGVEAGFYFLRLDTEGFAPCVRKIIIRP